MTERIANTHEENAKTPCPIFSLDEDFTGPTDVLSSGNEMSTTVTEIDVLIMVSEKTSLPCAPWAPGQGFWKKEYDGNWTTIDARGQCWWVECVVKQRCSGRMPPSKNRWEQIAIDGVTGQPKWDTRLCAMGLLDPTSPMCVEMHQLCQVWQNSYNFNLVLP